MTFAFNLLHVFVAQSINPVYLLDRSLSQQDFEKSKAFLNKEGQLLRVEMMTKLFGPALDSEKENYLRSLQRHLVAMSDIVNQYLFRDKKVWMTHPDATLIRANYLHSLGFFQEQLHFSAVNFPAYYDQRIKMTDYYLKNALPQLRHAIYGLKESLYEREISLQLVDLIVKGLNGLLQDHQLSPNNADYITGLISEFERYSILNDETVISVLIKLNFNQPEFYLFVTKSLNDRLLEINGLHEQKELILQDKQEMWRIDKQLIYSLHPGEKHIRDEIVNFFNEKSVYLDELMALRRVALNDKYESEKAFRMLVGLTVPQLALFYRMQMEIGVLSKEGKTELFNFVAHHFYTEKTVFISSQNLLRKSTNVEFSTALRLWEILAEMMEWLDTNFSIRQYART